MMDNANRPAKIHVLLEIIIVFVASIGMMWFMHRTPAFEEWQRNIFGKVILTGFLSIVIVPLIAAWLNRHDKSASFVVNLNKLKNASRKAGKALIVMMPVTFLSFPVVQGMGYSFYSWSGGLIIAGWHLLAIPVLCLLFKKYDVVQEAGFSATDLVRILGIFFIAAILIYGLNFLHPKASGVLISLVYIGFAEEFMYRGYLQGRLNQAFGKSFSIMSFSFGWGLIIAALLFGLSHVITPPNPWHLPWGIWTFAAGLCFGIIREKGGSFLASALVHGIIIIFPVFFG